jgi:hypothetical protein
VTANEKEDSLNINLTSASSRIRLLLGPSALLLSASLFALGAGHAAAQNADMDADSYADDLEKELGSSPADPDSTPEHFALLWTCTDGNDNDRDGKRDFLDPGCRNTVPGSSPTPAPTQAPGGGGSGAGSGGGSGGGSNGGGTGDGTGGGSGSDGSSGSGGASGGGGSSSAGENAVLGGSGGPIGGGAGDGSGSSGAAGDTATGTGQDSGIGTDSAATGATSADAGGEAGAGDENAPSDGSGDDGRFPWLVSLLILLAGFAAGAVCWALLGRSRARSRASATTARY